MLAPRLHELTRRLFIVFLLRHTIITRLPPGLPALSPIISLLSDITVREMACHNRTLAPSKATRDDVQASTYRSTPSLSQMIQHTEQENERLQRRVACQHRMEEASMEFLGEVQGFLEKLQQAVNIFEDLQLDIKQDVQDDRVLMGEGADGRVFYT